jgi:energy-coupling factor transporter transmembrane protein EcfT
LFARSIQRAEQIHRSMEARGHDRRFPVLQNPNFRTADLLFAAACACLACLVRLGIS